MSNRKILNQLYLIAKKQQKAICKLAQLPNDIDYLKQFINSSVGLFLTNNRIFAKNKYTLENSDDPNKDYKVTITLSPATNKPLEEDASVKLQQFLTAKIAQDPTLKSKSIDLDVKSEPTH